MLLVEQLKNTSEKKSFTDGKKDVFQSQGRPEDE
jgi:hypothetical protein